TSEARPFTELHLTVPPAGKSGWPRRAGAIGTDGQRPAFSGTHRGRNGETDPAPVILERNPRLPRLPDGAGLRDSPLPPLRRCPAGPRVRRRLGAARPRERGAARLRPRLLRGGEGHPRPLGPADAPGGGGPLPACAQSDVPRGAHPRRWLRVAGRLGPGPRLSGRPGADLRCPGPVGRGCPPGRVIRPGLGVVQGGRPGRTPPL